jgi:BirA family biotin operon repressor/biotin-[acetyl-CoA-carboxylase] ligase
MPIIAGLAVSIAIENIFQIQTSVKWPNDILFKEKKLAGILCRNKDKYILIGMGINCNQSSFSKKYIRLPNSLSRILNKEIDRFKLLIEILTILKKTIKDPNWKDVLEQKLYLKDKECIIICGQDPGSKKISCTIKGINKDGALIIRDTKRKVDLTIFSGSIL